MWQACNDVFGSSSMAYLPYPRTNVIYQGNWSTDWFDMNRNPETLVQTRFNPFF